MYAKKQEEKKNTKKRMQFVGKCRICKKQVETTDVDKVYSVVVYITKSESIKSKQRFVMDCPTCGNQVKINKTEIAEDIQILIKQRS